MSTVAESSIFAAPEAADTGGGWPMSEDVFAEDPSQSDEHAWLGEDADTEFPDETGWQTEDSDTEWTEYTGGEYLDETGEGYLDETDADEDEYDETNFDETSVEEADYLEDVDESEEAGEVEEAEADEYDEYEEFDETLTDEETFPSGVVLTARPGPTGPGEEHYDPNKTGLPLYDTGPDVRAKKLSANFTVGELVTSGGRPADRARISPALVACLQAIRDRSGRPVKITSGYRSWARNTALYRARGKKPTDSRHCSGQAADITITGLTGMQIAKLAIDAYGANIGIGIGKNFAHIDVRGRPDTWTYFTGKQDTYARNEINNYRTNRTTPTPPPQPTPTPTPIPTPAAPGSVRAGRKIVDRLPLLSGHAGTPPDLIVEWNDMVAPSVVDVVVHLHGFSGKGSAMNIRTDKKPISGLDFTDPANPVAVGRTSPTVLVLPRGSHQPQGKYDYNPERYAFPALVKPGALQKLIDQSLASFARDTGVAVRQNRLIVTAHSGGGAALMAILGHTDPDEVYTFDALYNDPTNLIEWARRRMAAGTGALRVLYRPGEKTARNSERVAKVVHAAGSPNFRVERTNVHHNHIPRRFGWRLLADASADLPGVVAARESEDVNGPDEFDGEFWIPQEGDGEYWGETDPEAEEFAEEVDSPDCTGCGGRREENSEDEEAPHAAARRTLGPCKPAQDDRKPEAPWSEMQERFRKRCSLLSHRIDAKSAIDCACAFGDPRDVAIFAMARVIAAGPLAARLFGHFLGSTGTEVTIDVADMIKRSAGVRKKIRNSISRGGMSGTTRIEQGEFLDSDLQFAYGAIDCVQWRVQGPAPENWRKNPATRLEISMLDYYEFHPERKGVSQCAHAACVELVARGSAKNFWTSGSAVITWGQLAGQPPAPTPRERRHVVYQNVR